MTWMSGSPPKKKTKQKNQTILKLLYCQACPKYLLQQVVLDISVNVILSSRQREVWGSLMENSSFPVVREKLDVKGKK